MYQRLSLWAKTVKFLQENIAVHVYDLRSCNASLDKITKAQVKKEKRNCMSSKWKTFVFERLSVKCKRKPKGLQKDFTNHIFDKELVSGIYKELL